MNCTYEYNGCQYYKNGECIYHDSKIKIESAQACYEDKRLDRIECELDYLDGTWL